MNSSHRRWVRKRRPTWARRKVTAGWKRLELKNGDTSGTVQEGIDREFWGTARS